MSRVPPALLDEVADESAKAGVHALGGNVRLEVQLSRTADRSATAGSRQCQVRRP